MIDLNAFLQGSRCEEDCRNLANVLRQYGAAAIYDPRVEQRDGDRFLDMMERYFEQPTEVKLKDARPELYYQVSNNLWILYSTKYNIFIGWSYSRIYRRTER